MKNYKAGTPVSRDIWISLLSMDNEKHKYNELCNCYFVADELIHNNTYKNLWRLTVRDAKSNELYCIKYILFRDDNGNLDVDIANPYFCKIYKI